MLAIEYVLGSLVVIEVPGFPAPCVVACLAGRAQRLLVNVVLHVAGHAGDLGVLEAQALVTVLAHDLLMLAQQGEPHKPWSNVVVFQSRSL